MNVAPKTNNDTCSCESSWYSKKRYKQNLQQIPGNPSLTEIQKTTEKHSTYFEKSVANLNQ